jgi:hypothetical protein
MIHVLQYVEINFWVVYKNVMMEILWIMMDVLQNVRYKNVHKIVPAMDFISL